MKNIITHYKRIFIFIVALVKNPQEILQYEKFTEIFGAKSLITTFILPMSFLVALMSFGGYMMSFSECRIEEGLVRAILKFLTLYASAIFSVIVVKQVVKRMSKQETSTYESEVIVVSLMAVTFIVNMLLSLMPNMFFVSFLYIYQLYLAWILAENIARITENSRNTFMITVTIIIIVIPIIVNQLFKLLVPNLL